MTDKKYTWDEFIAMPPGTVARYHSSPTLIRGDGRSVFWINPLGNIVPAEICYWRSRTFTMHDMVADIRVTFTDRKVSLHDAEPGWYKSEVGVFYKRSDGKNLLVQDDRVTTYPHNHQVVPCDPVLHKYDRHVIFRSTEGLVFKEVSTNSRYYYDPLLKDVIQYDPDSIGTYTANPLLSVNAKFHFVPDEIPYLKLEIRK